MNCQNKQTQYHFLACGELRGLCVAVWQELRQAGKSQQSQQGLSVFFVVFFHYQNNNMAKSLLCNHKIIINSEGKNH